jgi:hypothetical protein
MTDRASQIAELCEVMVKYGLTEIEDCQLAVTLKRPERLAAPPSVEKPKEPEPDPDPLEKLEALIAAGSDDAVDRALRLSPLRPG